MLSLVRGGIVLVMVKGLVLGQLRFHIETCPALQPVKQPDLYTVNIQKVGKSTFSILTH